MHISVLIVVHETLENHGVLGQLRARIRAEVFSALNDPTDSRPEISHENFLINELIREYLDFNHYKYASSVLTAGLYVYLVYTDLTLFINIKLHLSNVCYKVKFLHKHAHHVGSAGLTMVQVVHLNRGL